MKGPDWLTTVPGNSRLRLGPNTSTRKSVASLSGQVLVDLRLDIERVTWLRVASSTDKIRVKCRPGGQARLPISSDLLFPFESSSIPSGVDWIQLVELLLCDS